MRSYLESNGNEVVDIIMNMFTQEYVTEMYGKEREKIGKIEGAMENTVKMCRRFGATLDEAINMLVQDFGLTSENAAQYVNKLWKD